MTGALRSEYRKLTTTSVWAWLTALSIGLTVLFTALFSAQVDRDDPMLTLPIATVFTFVGGIAYIIAAVIGVIGLTGEYRHLTATPTFLSVPRRGTVVSAKLVVYVLYGLALGVACIGLALAVAVPWLDGRGFDVDLGSATMVRVIIGNVLSVAIFGLIGVGVGALLKNQVAAVVGIVLYLFVLENLIGIIPGVRSIWPYLPGGAQMALTQTPDTIQQVGDVNLLSAWQGGVLLLAYGLAFVLAGTWTSVRRDIT